MLEDKLCSHTVMIVLMAFENCCHVQQSHYDLYTVLMLTTPSSLQTKHLRPCTVQEKKKHLQMYFYFYVPRKNVPREQQRKNEIVASILKVVLSVPLGPTTCHLKEHCK